MMLLLAFSLAGCSETPDMPLQKWTLENEYLAISWESQQGLAFQATEVRNKKDGQQLDLAGVDLFAIELADGDWLNNRDFVLMGEVVRDALPVDSETEQSGKQLSARLRHKQSGIEVIWRAALHDQRNYVRQVFTIKNLGEVAVDVAAVHLWRGDVNTARPAGDVLGSVIVADNTFLVT
ncbi:MAG: hypothetical protein OIF34_06915, partial [Porticoccaceae bacterium]|nr:hypothetical protein [Porticoccaceae bacterium]